MYRDRLLVVMATTGSAFCWWPVIMQPNLDFPFWWLPLMLVACMAGLSAILSEGAWLRFTVASFLGTWVGVFVGFRIWWPTDRIAASFVPIVETTAMLASIAVSLPLIAALRSVTLLNDKRRRAAWFALVCCVAFGPVSVALTPPLVVDRMARNDRVARERTVSLNNAALKAVAEMGGPGRICDGSALKRHYSGPMFSEKDWRYIGGNSVKRDGYIFAIFCHGNAGYVINVRPDRETGDGTRTFYADEAGVVECDIKCNGSRRKCMPCSQ